MDPMRIVSLLPSATEIVCALGAERSLVGRSAECDFPPSIRDRPVVMRPRTEDFDRPSGAIDRRVRAARARSESLYTLDIDALRSLRPDLILTQDLCSVCSVTNAEVEVACRQAELAPSLVSLTPRTLSEVWASVSAVGTAIGRPAEAARLRRRLRARGVGTSPPAGARPRVAVVEWLDPPILAGLWVPEMVELAGGRPVGPPAGAVGERTTWDELREEAPELVVLSPCSFSLSRTVEEARAPRIRRVISSLEPRLGSWVADEAYFSRPGPRLADGVALLRGLLRGGRVQGPMPVERWRDPGGPA
jgi:iron complex transport system substrate-binding protein